MKQEIEVSPELKRRLRAVSRVLGSKREFMARFMKHYIFDRCQVQADRVLASQNEFMSAMKFCLRTRQRTVNSDLRNGLRKMRKLYPRIKQSVHDGDDINELGKDVYSPVGTQRHVRGVGQKVGSLILEVLIHYGQANPELEEQLYVPIDTHVFRVLTDCLGVKAPPNVKGATYNAARFQALQKLLKESAATGVPRICFDYLWFVGKVFCTEAGKEHAVTEEKHPKKRYPRTFRLCSLCWIRRHCIYEPRWDVPSRSARARPEAS